MRLGRTIGPAGVARRLASLPEKPLNFDLQALSNPAVEEGWRRTDLRQPLAPEAPGPPVAGGTFEIAQRLMSGYEFADPSIVQAYYDEHVPLQRRNMLLKLKALGLVHVFVGVRVGEVYELTREVDGRRARVWGWNYRTLEGHVEQGQMDWQVWKWLDDGGVEFRVHAISRPAPISNPLVALGFRLLGERERRVFLDSTRSRMLAFTQRALRERDGAGAVRAAAEGQTARADAEAAEAHERLARRLR